jgi:glycosyltransferase involved in cell wall biosynthesis
MGLVSVCMAAYNGERTIWNQIDSILRQLGEHDELIISDDASIDNTVAQIQQINDSRIKLYVQTENVGITKNFEKAILKANNEYIFLADQDDYWEPGKVDSVKKRLTRYDLIIHDCSVIGERDEILTPSFFEKNHSRSGYLSNIIRNSYMGCCMAFHRRILERIIPFPDNLAYDQWIGLVTEKHYHPYFLHENLVRYKRHGANYSTTAGISRLTFVEKISYRIALMYNLRRV